MESKQEGCKHDFHERVEQAMQHEREEMGELAWSIMPDEDKLEIRKRVTRELAQKDIEGVKNDCRN